MLTVDWLRMGSGWSPRRFGVVGGTLLLLGLTGCARALTIHQGMRINTAMHANRAPEKQTGEPLELNIVVVYPQDLKKAENDALKPDSKITAKVWYTRRPERASEPASGRFVIPKDQIYLLTKEEDSAKLYGHRIGPALGGAERDGNQPYTKGGINVGWDHLHDGTVIYVFPRFIGKDGGNVLAVPPVKYDPPGAYPANLEVEIGVQSGARSLDEAQYIKNLTPRKLHGSDKGN